MFSLEATDEDIELVEMLVDVGKQSLQIVGKVEEEFMMGFHIPPANSSKYYKLLKRNGLV